MKEYQPKYWNSKGKYQKEYEMLSKMHIPFQGDALTKQGQLLRCVSNFYYQRYNNGFSRCNPLGRFTEYIRRYAKSHKLSVRIVQDMTRQALDKEVDKVVKHLMETELESLGKKDSL